MEWYCAALPHAHLALVSGRPSSRWARFELNQQDASGDLQTGKPVALVITFGGVTQGTGPIVALCESILFEPQLITLEPDDESSTLKAEVTLDPMPSSRTSVHQKAARIQVTFARARPRAGTLHEAHCLCDARPPGAVE